MEKIKKRSVVWVRVNTEKDNNVRYNMLLKLFISPCPFAFQTLAKHYLICWLVFFFLSQVCKLTFLIICLFHCRQQNSYLARTPSQRDNVMHSWQCLQVHLFVFAKYILNVLSSLFITEAQGAETSRNVCFEISPRYMHTPHISRVGLSNQRKMDVLHVV